ncbi:MAG: hypothetical protein MJY73_01060 [Bacteroidales bacterium]|nr:hypothetical protein [Bacteroidales bacterium]
MNNRIIILVAEEAEARMVQKYLPEAECVRTGVGASNVIKTCCGIPAGTKVFNIGYAGSNSLTIGTVTAVSQTFRLMSDAYKFVDHNNPLCLGGEGFPCYTSNSFVTESDKVEPTLFDMELNYMAAFPLEMVGAIKIVSDNLSVDAFQNNAIRESGILTSAEVWEKVAALYRSIINKE